MDRKECYRLTHPLSKIPGYATGYGRCSTASEVLDGERDDWERWLALDGGLAAARSVSATRR